MKYGVARFETSLVIYQLVSINASLVKLTKTYHINTSIPCNSDNRVLSSKIHAHNATHPDGERELD